MEAQRTLKDCYRFFMKVHSKPHKKSWRHDEGNYKRYLEQYGSWPIEKFMGHMLEFHAEVGVDIGKRTANVLLTTLNTMLRVNGLEPPKIKKFVLPSRDRFLDEEELAIFLDVIETVHAQLRDFLKLCLYTSARSGNVRRMRWEQIDFSKRLWLIPGNEFKNGHPQRVPLNATAVEILQRRHKNRAKRCRWVFPARRGKNKGTGPMQQPTRIRGAWKRVVNECAERGVEHFTLHDLRRVGPSLLVSSGVSLPIIGALLGHRSLQSTRIYARLTNQPVVDAADAMGSIFDQISDE